jgi:predicted MFS family arabinose efflux permease
LIASQVDWRVAFFAVGLAGIALAPVFRLSIKEPSRGRYDPAQGARHPAGLRELGRVLGTKPSFWLVSLGASSASMMGYGLYFWLPSLFVRSHGLTLLDASLYFGAIVLVGGLAGIWGGGWLGDRLGRLRRTHYLVVPAVAFFATAPLYVLALFSPSLTLTFVALLPPTALGLAWLGPVVAVIQHLVRPGMRATASAVYLFILNLIGLGLGTWALGAMSDALSVRFGAESLRYSILAGTGLYMLAAALLLLATRWLERDWAD